MMSATAALTKAIKLADWGLPVFPCAASKRPTCPHGFKEATRDVTAVRALWRGHPGPLIGVPTAPLQASSCSMSTPRNMRPPRSGSSAMLLIYPIPDRIGRNPAAYISSSNIGPDFATLRQNLLWESIPEAKVAMSYGGPPPSSSGITGHPWPSFPIGSLKR